MTPVTLCHWTAGKKDCVHSERFPVLYEILKAQTGSGRLNRFVLLPLFEKGMFLCLMKHCSLKEHSLHAHASIYIMSATS